MERENFLTELRALILEVFFITEKRRGRYEEKSTLKTKKHRHKADRAKEKYKKRFFFKQNQKNRPISKDAKDVLDPVNRITTKATTQYAK